jgi:hypothetical protein
MDKGRSPHESALFWTGVAGGVLALAGVTLGVASAKQSVLADAGIAIAVFGALILAWAVRVYFVRRRAGQLTPLEEWLQERIAAAATLARQRGRRGNDWYFAEMNTWDTANVNRLLFGEEGQTALAPDLVDSYREDPRTGHADGIYPPHDAVDQDRYYEQRKAWLESTFGELRASK